MRHYIRDGWVGAIQKEVFNKGAFLEVGLGTITPFTSYPEVDSVRFFDLLRRRDAEFPSNRNKVF